MSLNKKEIEGLIKILKKHGIEEFQHGEIKIKLSAVEYAAKVATKLRKNDSDKITEDDLYYSTNLKPRIK